MAEQAVGCGPIGNKRAVFVVEYYGPKGIGPADAQDFMECIICEFHELKGVTSINGPDFTSLDNRPLLLLARQLRTADTTRIRLGQQAVPALGRPT